MANLGKRQVSSASLGVYTPRKCRVSFAVSIILHFHHRTAKTFFLIRLLYCALTREGAYVGPIHETTWGRLTWI